MDFLYLFIACFLFSLQSVFSKLFAVKTKATFSVCLWNQLVTAIAAAIFVFAKSGIPTSCNPVALIWIVGYSASAIICSVSSLKALDCGNLAIFTTFSLVGGMVVPFFYGIIFLGETASPLKIIGIIILCLSLAPAFFGVDAAYEGSQKPSAKFLIYSVLVFFTNGMVSVCSKGHQVSEYSIGEDNFLLISKILIISATLIMMLGSALSHKLKGEKNVIKNTFWEISRFRMVPRLFILLILFSAAFSICNTVANIFSLKCMLTMDASIQFPLLSAAVILISAFLGRIFFKERLTKTTAATLLISAAGIGVFMISEIM